MDRRQANRLLLGLAVTSTAAALGCGGSGAGGPQKTGLKPDPETVAADEEMQRNAQKYMKKGAR